MTDKTTAPRVTIAHIDAMAATLIYDTVRMPNTATTIASARLPWGFTVAEARAACVSPANFDVEKSEQRALAVSIEARNKLWELEGYRLAHAVAHSAGGEG